MKWVVKCSVIGGEGELVRFRLKFIRCDVKYFSVDVLMFDDDDEFDDEDLSFNLFWLNVVI